MSEPIITMRGIVKKYHIGKPNELEILHGIDMDVQEGEFVSIVGASGAGKSTLMNIIGVLDRATSGSYTLAGTKIESCKDKELSAIRSRKIGFVFQNFNLIQKISALENVALPMMYAGLPRKKRMDRAAELLDLVGMKERMKHKPTELSGGQMQRVAIARAMANDPDIILADEPTGALDSKTGALVMKIFHQLNQKQGKTIVLITHNNDLAEETDRIYDMSDGRFVSVRTLNDGKEAR
ncbi:ABC transporter ATP-binding protein [Eubacterium sp. F2]|jgi:putative ABC transport system ATP-binding protein|uniref:ABC transporter ATP-binding protein n=1 Tax=Eubacterium sp. F2 TaxID=3381348 RepID=UPI003907FCC3